VHKYEYQACDIEGNIQYGRLTAENEQAVISSLQHQQLIPLKIEIIEGGGTGLLGGSKISNRDLIDFTNGLTTLIEARIPIDRALVLLEGITNKPALQKLIADLRSDVKEGKSLADALQNHPHLFSRMYINMVHAGEEGGILDKLLPKLASFLASADEAKRTLLSAMIYPMILLLVGILSVAMLMVFVVPQFAQLFEDMGSNMPGSAAFLLASSSWLQSYGLWLFAIPPILWLGWKKLDSSPELQLQRDRFLLNLPIFGNLLLDAESSRFCRTLGSLLSAGIPLLKALHIVRGVMENAVISSSLERVEEAVRSGASLGKSLISENIFPVLLAQLVVVGEESGRTADILEKLAATFDNNVKHQTTRLVALAEPLLILLLGIVVGGIVIIMLSAIFSINDVQF
jgi:general secretion pathway protein F